MSNWGVKQIDKRGDFDGFLLKKVAIWRKEMHNIYIEFWGERKVMKKLSKYDKKKLEVHKRYDA